MAEVAEAPAKEEVKGKEPLPKDVDAKLKRGRDGLNEVVARRQLGIRFANGQHFAELNDAGTKLTDVSTSTTALGGEKPDHRVRRSHDIISPMLKRKISVATTREPEWESTASTRDPEDYAASRLAMRLARAGYSLWGFRPAENKALWWAMVTEEAFARASWNANVGPFTDVSRHPEADVEDEEGNKPYEGQPDPESPVFRGRGEIEVTVYSGLEVLWEPGVDFEKSRWYAVEHARAIEEIEDEPDFLEIPNGKLQPDAATATTRSTSKEKKGAKLCIVTEYFERPCPKHPQGRWGTYANGRKIFKDEDYPLQDAAGKVVDRPCLRRLIYDVDASSDRAKGLVQQLVDTVRSYDQAINKQSEYTQIGLVAQVIAAEGVLLTDPTDEPGLVIEYDRTLANGEKPEWRPSISFPGELFNMEERAKQRFAEISFDEAIPPGVRASSAEAVNQLIALNKVAWQQFVDDFDRFRSDLMSDCLVLAQRHYSSDRILKFRGTTGWESVEDFEGADLRDQSDVRVRQSGTQMQTRSEVEQRILQLVQVFPGVFPPEVVIEALNSATPEKLIEGYEEDVGRAHRIIEQMRAGTFWDQPPRPVLPGEEAPKLDPETGLPEWIEEPSEEVPAEVDPGTGEPIPGTGAPANPGQPVMLTEVPGWLPRPFDSIPILKSAMEGWMKSDDWERAESDVKQASLHFYQVLLDLEAKKSQRSAELQNQLAEQQGMANATKEQAPKPMPSLPGTPAPPQAPPPPGE